MRNVSCQLGDTIFNKSVILINDYNQNGSMGFVLNKPIPSNNSNSIISDITNKKIKENVYFGGPVQIDSYFVLHDKSYKANDSEKITQNLYLTSNTNIINDIIKVW